jgi:hypothetical protein
MLSRSRLRYRFDNVMARGVGAQVMLLAVVTVVLVVIGAAATIVLGVRPVDDGHPDSFGKLVWLTLMHSLDAGMLGGDSFSSWAYLAVMLGVTIGGLFVVSALIGVLNQGFGELLDGLRRGRSVVVEQGHTVILGWSSKVFPLLSELAEANRNQRDACVVIMADRDKVEMDEEIANAFGGSRLRVVTRRGDALNIDDLGLVALDRSKAVIVLAPERHADGAHVPASEADAVVLKALLAIRKIVPDRRVHVVAEILDERTGPVARMVLGDRAALVLTGPLISRLLVQTGRQSGLSDVYGELLDFAGHEIYLHREPQLAGVTFREAVFRYGSSCLIGVMTADDELLLPPPHDRPFAADDRVVVISEDDDRIVLDGTTAPDPSVIAAPTLPPTPLPERILVLGNSPRLNLVLRELDGFMAVGSGTTVVGAGDPDALRAGLDGVLQNMEVTANLADITDRGVLDGLHITGFDHVLLLSEPMDRSQDMADARTIISLLHLRDIVQEGKVPIISEILDVRNRDLASTGDRDDFIVSNRLVSLVMSQIAETPYLARIFDELLGKEGHELYVKPVTDYVRLGEVTFATVCEAALRRGEIAIGYRPAVPARHGGASVVVNPAKSLRLFLEAEDKIIVLAES